GGRAGHARGDMRSREAPSRAPTGDSARGPGVCETPGPHPVTRRRRASSTSAQADPASRSGQIHAVFNVHPQSWCKRCGSTPRAWRARRRKRRACATACSRWPYGSSAPSGASSCTSPRRSPGSRRGARLPAPSAPRPDALRHGACLTPAAVSLPTAGAPRCLPASWRHVKDITPFRRAADRLNEPLWATVPASHTTHACSRIIRARRSYKGLTLTDEGIVVLGIPIPSSSPFFLATVGVHVAAGLTCVIAGVVAMLSSKRVGRHPSAGTVYYWSLVVV